MLDQMSMPVLFAILISALALVSLGVVVGVRIIAQRADAGGSVPVKRDGPRAGESPQAPADDATKPTLPREI
ncbi:hypothetical protein [Kribbella sp. NPDC004875]|uniref:hypothetical protein n=1 Tax=Kribbella sp. NPDC004875 TaxID=3364107 RepID=UPI00367D587F